MTNSDHISQLEGIIVTQAQQIKSLEGKLLLALEELRKKGIKKDSTNSSLPPSTDFSNKNKSLRKPSELKSGAQKGHQGNTLEMSSNPDKIIDLKDNFCNVCGESLLNSNFVLKAKRQVIQIRPTAPIYEEFRQYSCECSSCKHIQVADFPATVNAPIHYGSSVESLVSYLSIYQYVPFARLKSLFSQVFSIPLSQGTISNILERAAVKCQPFYQPRFK